ncbi:chemokine-like protein TAFA-5 isoform X2 [Saimiri boliviensis]|uniref:chemokine-like protein TAFA-5 isoform X2 n=1 Tax=Saimiri boliviensis TaxID=27679 RepID=UPI003D7891E0
MPSPTWTRPQDAGRTLLLAGCSIRLAGPLLAPQKSVSGSKRSSRGAQGPSPCARWRSCQLAAGTCEIVTLDRDSSQPRRTIARQTARCACRKGQIAGTTRARPACVDARIIKTKQWCDMLPCLEGEGCDLLINRSGWTCTQPGGRIKTTTVS